MLWRELQEGMAGHVPTALVSKHFEQAMDPIEPARCEVP